MKSILNQISKLVWWQKKPTKLLQTGKPLQNIAQRLLDYMSSVKEVALNLFFHLFFVLMGILALLYSLKFLWIGYQSSPIGQKYTQIFMERSYLISDFLSQDLFSLSIKIIWISFSTCFMVCCGLKFFHITTLMYNSRRGIINLLLFGLPLALISGWYLYQLPMILSFKQGIILSALPTLLFFPKCFDATTELVPELRDLYIDFKIFLTLVRNKGC